MQKWIVVQFVNKDGERKVMRCNETEKRVMGVGWGLVGGCRWRVETERTKGRKRKEIGSWTYFL